MTPLQTLIAEKIIEKEDIDKAESILLYIGTIDNQINRAYFQRLASGFKYSEFLQTGRSLGTVLRMRNLLYGKSCKIYVAGIDDSLIHYAISFLKKPELYTFDDGTANIMPQSTYFTGVKRPFIREYLLRFAHFLLGKRFNLEKTKSSTIKHYSIYNGFPNAATAEIEYLSLFTTKRTVSANKKNIKVFLGTVYDEATRTKDDADFLWKNVQEFLKENGEDIIYIQHPREKRAYGCSSNDRRIAEEIILDLRKSYATVDLYGFGSSTQFNLVNVESINVIPVYSEFLLDKVNSTLSVLKDRTHNQLNI